MHRNYKIKSQTHLDSEVQNTRHERTTQQLSAEWSHTKVLIQTIQSFKVKIALTVRGLTHQSKHVKFRSSLTFCDSSSLGEKGVELIKSLIFKKEKLICFTSPPTHSSILSKQTSKCLLDRSLEIQNFSSVREIKVMVYFSVHFYAWSESHDLLLTTTHLN